MTRARLSLIAASLLLSGCSLAPKTVLPAPPVPESWPVGDAYLTQSEAALPMLSYRQLFPDPRLHELIEQALASTTNLPTASADVASPRAHARVPPAAHFPPLRGTHAAPFPDGSSRLGTPS